MARRSTRKVKRSRRSRTRRQRRQRGGANNNNNNNALVAALEAGMNERINLNALNREYLGNNYVANNNVLARRNIPKLVLPANTENTITSEKIKSGNTLVNFRGNSPNSFESKFQRYYKKNTVNQLNNKHPQTRGAILEATEYKAQIGNNNNNSNNNINNNTIEKYFTRKAQKGTKKPIYENLRGLPR